MDFILFFKKKKRREIQDFPRNSFEKYLYLSGNFQHNL